MTIPLTKEENIFLAKRYIVDVIHSAAKIENLNVTFPQTQTIIDNGKIYGLNAETVSKVVNLHNAWKYVLNNIDAKLDLAYICKINEYVANGESLEWGKLRNGTVGVTIDATRSVHKDRIPANYEPEIKEKINDILNQSDPRSKAADYLAYAIPEQLFWDGNKRTSFIIANKILIDDRQGLFIIPEAKQRAFAKALSKIYLQNDPTDLKTLIKEQCITRQGFHRERNDIER